LSRFYAMAIVGAALVAFGIAGEATAQTRPVTFGISGGPSLPVGDYADEAELGFHVQGSLGFTPGALPLGIRADLLWQELGEEHGSFREIGGIVNGILALPAAGARPYALVGVGMVNRSEPEEDHGDHAHEGDSDNTIAFTAGVGLEFGLLGLGGVLEARYLAAGAGHHTIPISFGIRF